MKIERIILFTKGIETLSFFSEQLGKTLVNWAMSVLL